MGAGRVANRSDDSALPPAPLGRAASRALVAVPLVAVVVLLAPYLWPLDHAPTSSFSDIRQYHGPMTQLLAAGLRRDGELPRWNVQDFAGTPTLGDPQTQMHNPLHWPLFVRPSLHAFGLLIGGYTLAGAAGFLLYARSLGLSVAGAAAGAVAFTLGGKLLLHLVVPGHTVFAPFFLVPFVLLSLEGAVRRPSAGRIAAGATLVAVLLVSLHPQLLFYAAFMIAAVCAASAWGAPRPVRGLAAVAAAAVLGLALAAVHLVPVGAFAREFTRGQPALFDVARAGSDPGRAGAEIGPHDGWAADMVSGRSAGAEVDWEAHYYVGGVTLMLAAVALLGWPRGDPRRRLVWLHAGLACVLLLVGLGGRGGVEPWLRILPGFAYFRIPARALVLLGFPLALLAGLGTDALVRGTVGVRGAAAAVVLAGAALWASGASAVHLVTLLVAVAGTALLARFHGVGALLVVAALAADTALVVGPHVATAPEATMGRLPSALTLPADLAATVRFAELDPRGAAPLISQLEVRRRGLERLAGYNPLIPWRFALYAAHAGGFDPFRQRFDVAVPLPRRAEPALLDLLGVTYLLQPPAVAGGFWRWERSDAAFPRAYLVPGPIVVPEGRDETLLAREEDALAALAGLDAHAAVLLHGDAAGAALAALGVEPGATFEPYRPVALTTRSANRLTLDVTLAHPAILVLNEPFFPGWRARDGERELPVLRANVLFRALALAPGEHRLVLEFAPASWRVGWWISAGAVLATLALAAVALARRRRPPPEPGPGGMAS